MQLSEYFDDIITTKSYKYIYLKISANCFELVITHQNVISMLNKYRLLEVEKFDFLICN